MNQRQAIRYMCSDVLCVIGELALLLPTLVLLPWNLQCVAHLHTITAGSLLSLPWLAEKAASVASSTQQYTSLPHSAVCRLTSSHHCGLPPPPASSSCCCSCCGTTTLTAPLVGLAAGVPMPDCSVPLSALLGLPLGVA